MKKLAKRLKRRTQRKRLGEKWPTKRSHWLKLFPREIQMVEDLNRVRLKIEGKTLKQSESQIIGKLRERKVAIALKNLKEQGKIFGYLVPGKLSYYDLIEGVDFLFVYVDVAYKICRFSVTGKKWIEIHQRKHPEIPVIPIDLDENIEFIEQKILFLKENNNNHVHK